MSVETEVKFRIADPRATLDRLRAVDAQPAGFAFEVNHILDTRDGRLLAAGCGLRVRESRPLDGAAARVTLTYKGPRDDDGAVKRREEIEVEAAETGALLAILERLGFVERIRYEKRRESWRLGECEVVIDELPRLGWWLEIEGPDAAALGRVQQRLKLPDSDLVSETYVEIVAREGHEGEDGRRVLTFQEASDAGP